MTLVWQQNILCLPYVLLFLPLVRYQGLFNNYVALKFPFLTHSLPTIRLQHKWPQEPYVTLRSTRISTLSFISLFFEVEKIPSDIHPPMIHPPIFLSSYTKLSGLNKKEEKLMQNLYFQWATFKGDLVSHSFSFPSIGDELEIKLRCFKTYFNFHPYWRAL